MGARGGGAGGFFGGVRAVGSGWAEAGSRGDSVLTAAGPPDHGVRRGGPQVRRDFATEPAESHGEPRGGAGRCGDCAGTGWTARHRPTGTRVRRCVALGLLRCERRDRCGRRPIGFGLQHGVGSENGMVALLDRAPDAARGLPRRYRTISPVLFCGLPEAMMLYRPWRLHLGSARPSWRRMLLPPVADLRPMNPCGRCGARTDRAASLELNSRHYRRSSRQVVRRLWCRIQNIIDLLLQYPDIGTSIDDPTIRRMTTSPCPIAFSTK